VTPPGDTWFGRFRAERKKLITQDALVAKLGCTRRSVSRWENGHNYPDEAYRPALAALSPTMTKLIAEIPPAQAADRSHLQKLEARIVAFEKERAQLGPDVLESVKSLDKQVDDLRERVVKLEVSVREREVAPARTRSGRPR
jgi:transcriptional regulator with XRE-family HTH domain